MLDQSGTDRIVAQVIPAGLPGIRRSEEMVKDSRLPFTDARAQPARHHLHKPRPFRDPIFAPLGSSQKVQMIRHDDPGLVVPMVGHGEDDLQGIGKSVIGKKRAPVLLAKSEKIDFGDFPREPATDPRSFGHRD